MILRKLRVYSLRFTDDYLYIQERRKVWRGSCSSNPENVNSVDALPEIYPDYTDVTIPVGLAPLNFGMADEDYTTIDVEVKGSKCGSIHTNGAYADFDIDEWHQLLEQNKGGTLTFSVCAEKNGRWTGFKDFTISVSSFPLGEWGITYRRIPPSYELFSQMGLYQRNLSNFEETPLLVNSQTPDQWLNCHTPNGTNPDQYVFHVRGEHGATAICTEGNIRLLKAKNGFLGGSMVYPFWHPSGRYCAFSTYKTSQMFHTKKNKRIEVYDTSSDVFIYDCRTNRIVCDPLIMTKTWAENSPAFSHDGKWLYRDRGKGVSWPRPSYDGRYLMYTQTDYGYFTIWHPEADLWLLDLKTGERRPMEEVNSERAEAWAGHEALPPATAQSTSVL